MGIIEKGATVLAIAGALVGAPQAVAEVQALSLPPVPGLQGISSPYGPIVDGVVVQPNGPISVRTSSQNVILRSTPNGPNLAFEGVEAGIARIDSAKLPPTSNGGAVGTVFLGAENCATILWGRACRTGPMTGFSYIRDITGPNISFVNPEAEKFEKGAKFLQFKLDERASVSVNNVKKGQLDANTSYREKISPTALGGMTATVTAEDLYGNATEYKEYMGDYDPIGDINVKKFYERVDQGKPYVSLDYVYQQAQSDGSFTSSVDLKQQIGVFTLQQDCHQYLPPANPNGERSSLCTWVPIDSRLEATFTAVDAYTGLPKVSTITKDHGKPWIPYAIQGTILIAPVIAYLANEGLKRRKMKTKKAKKGSGGSSGTGPKYSDPEVVVVTKPNQVLLPARTGKVNPHDDGDDFDPDGPSPHYGPALDTTPTTTTIPVWETLGDDLDDDIRMHVNNYQRGSAVRNTATRQPPTDYIDAVTRPVAQPQLTASTAETLPSRITVREKVFAR
jgi:hypothetical protein